MTPLIRRRSTASISSRPWFAAVIAIGSFLASPVTAFAGQSLSAEQNKTMRVVEGGRYEAFVLEKPALGKNLAPVTVSVKRFTIDTFPVTNQEYLEFVRANPIWKRSKVLLTFADRSYLSHWQDDLDVGRKQALPAPATFVSWFGAMAYCKAQGKRLPTLNEWEFAARPEAYGKDREKMLAKILDWYSKPAGEQVAVPSLKDLLCTSDDVCGLHGLVWEWVEDFGSILSSDDDRTGGTPDNGLFCGAGSIGTMDPNNYAAFMRYAFRASLKGAYTIGHLGFRCVK